MITPRCLALPMQRSHHRRDSRICPAKSSRMICRSRRPGSTRRFIKPRRRCAPRGITSRDTVLHRHASLLAAGNPVLLTLPALETIISRLIEGPEVKIAVGAKASTLPGRPSRNNDRARRSNDPVLGGKGRARGHVGRHQWSHRPCLVY